MTRLFIAIEVPYAAARDLERLRGGVPGARWIEPCDYHITLNFIGEVDGVQAREIAAALATINRPSFDLRLASVGSFGRSRPHSIHAAVEPNRLLDELQADTTRTLTRLGIELEARKFRPHVTVARIRNPDVAILASWLASRSGFHSDWFTAERFVLLSSRPSRGGGPYGLEHAYPLHGWPAEHSAT